MTQLTVQQALDTALKFHTAGRLQEAEPLYRQILAQVPTQPDALHMLGVLAHQVGRYEMALDLIGRAISVNSNAPAYHSNMGLALMSVGRKDEAIGAYRHALALRANYPEAYNNMAIVFYSRGQFDQAIEFYNKALELRPDYIDALHNLGDALTAKGTPEKAIDCYRRALALRPEWPEAHNNLGNAMARAGRHEEAIECYRQAVALNPNFPGAYSNLGNAFAALKKIKESLDFHRKALSLKPEQAESHYNLANTYAGAGMYKEAIASYHKAIELRPESPDFYGNLGGALYNTGQMDEAIAAFRKAVQLLPESDQTQFNLANAYYARGMIQESIKGFRQALAFKPDSVVVLNNLGNAFKDFAQLDEALTCYERAYTLEPRNPFSHRNRVYALNFHPGYDAQAILREHQAWNDQQARPLRKPAPPYENVPDPDRRLRIGYVSPDLRHHVVGQNILPLLANHDHENFEIFCYAAVAQPDSVTEQFRAASDHWRDIARMSDEEAVKAVRDDQIDILVDLALHMAGNRMSIFIQKPAPIQITFGGYPGTTGLETMDYRLSDPFLDPPQFDRNYTEKTIRLPDSFWCYDPVAMRVADQPITPLPALHAGHVTFGCLNNFTKVNDGTLELWAKVLAKVENSRLMLLVPRGDPRSRVAQKLLDCGIDSSRLQFVERSGRGPYLLHYHKIDIGLDTLPYNGHTTSLDSLWMGVPVVTLLGNTVAGRAGWSQLCNLDLKELAATTPDQFVEIAVTLAHDLTRLGELRASLRDRMVHSPLTDTKRFARSIEAAYRQVWQQWCSEQ
jgi:predicted O-linked N-acetylglucosamine transferase (SPINDLY family)